MLSLRHACHSCNRAICVSASLDVVVHAPTMCFLLLGMIVVVMSDSTPLNAIEHRALMTIFNSTGERKAVSCRSR